MTDEKNGKSGSTQSAQGLTAGVAAGCWLWRRRGTSPRTNASVSNDRCRPPGFHSRHSIIDRRVSDMPAPVISRRALLRAAGAVCAAPILPLAACRSNSAPAVIVLAPHRHPHRLGRPPVRGVPLPRAVPVRRPLGRSRDDPQRQLPRAHDGGGKEAWGFGSMTLGNAWAFPAAPHDARSGRDEGAGRRAAAR